MTMIPPTRPTLNIVDARKLLAAHGVTDSVILLGVRGYFDPAGQNKRGLYDDAIALLSPRLFKTYNANTDPSKQGGRLAVLQPGVWTFKRGVHHAGTPHEYPVLVQAAPVTVLRDNGVKETLTTTDPIGPGGYPPYIHIHQGGYNVTSSEGCQTIWPDQWRDFWKDVTGEMDFYALEFIDYLLAENVPQ